MVVAIIILFIVGIYNRLVSLRMRYKNAFAQIEVQLKRRYDLIPNLIETAKKYMEHEQETFRQVIEARNGAQKGLDAASENPGNPQAMQSLSTAESILSGALGKLNVVVENYPELKANENMMQFSEELTATENKVAFARQAYNDAVTFYNEYRASFPPVFFAALFGHPVDAEFLEFEDSAEIQQAPKVNFS